MITHLMVGLGDEASVEDIKARVTETFQSRFRDSKGIHIESWECWHTPFPYLDCSEVVLLEVSFSKKEIRK